MNREIGYSPDSAKKLSLWTLANNLIKDVKPGLKSGELSFTDAQKMFDDLGIPQDVSSKVINRIGRSAKKLRATKFVNKAIDESLKRLINAKDSSIEETKNELMGLGLDEEMADAEIALAIVAAKGDPEDQEENEALIETIREAQGAEKFGLSFEGRPIKTIRYTVNMEDEDNTTESLMIREDHEIGDKILVPDLGKLGEIVSKRRIFF